MAIFSPKKIAVQAETSVTPRGEHRGSSRGAVHVLIGPRVTEKATMKSGEHVYTFIVSRRATKNQIAEAVHQAFKVVPRKICIAPIPRKQISHKGKRGSTALGKKAYVYLKKGETIGFI